MHLRSSTLFTQIPSGLKADQQIKFQNWRFRRWRFSTLAEKQYQKVLKFPWDCCAFDIDDIPHIIFFCKSLEQSFCMITVINIECQTFKNGETGVIGNPKFEVWPRLPWHSSSHFNWKRVSLKDRQNRWWAEGAIGYPNFGPEIQVILISSFWKTSLEQRSLSLARKYRYPLCY